MNYDYRTHYSYKTVTCTCQLPPTSLQELKGIFLLFSIHLSPCNNFWIFSYKEGVPHFSGESCHLVTFWRVSGTKFFGPGENVEMEKLAVSWMILAAWLHCYHPFETSARSKLEYVVWSCKLEWNLEIMFESRHLSDVCQSLLSIHWWRNTYIAGRISMTIWAVFFTLEKKQNPLPLILAIYK